MPLYYDPAAITDMVAERGRLANALEDVNKFLFDTQDKKHDDIDLRKRRAEGEKHAALTRALDSLDLRIDSQKRLEPAEILKRGRSPALRWLRKGKNGLEADEIKVHLRPCSDDVASAFPQLAGKDSFHVEGPSAFGSQESPVNTARSDITTGAGAVGNANVERLSPNVIDRLAYLGAMEDMCTAFVTAEGGEYRHNFLDDTGQEGALVEQDSTTNVTQDFPTVGVATFKAHLMHSKPMNIRLEAYQDVHFDLQGRAERVALARMRRGWLTAFTTGNGTDPNPLGAVTLAKDGITTAANNAVSYADLLGMIYSVDYGYKDPEDMGGYEKPQAGTIGWMFNESLEHTVRGLVDGDQRPLWTPGISAGTWGLVEGQPQRLLGYPYRINNKMAAVAAGNIISLFGNFGYYGIRTVGMMEMYSLIDSGTLASHSAQIIAFTRRDARGIGGFDGTGAGAGDMEAFKKLTMKT